MSTTNLQNLKTYTLRCTYLGETKERAGISFNELQTSEAMRDLDADWCGEPVWKWSGNQLTSVSGSYIQNLAQIVDSEAYETGILSEGMGAGGTLADVVGLLEAVGMTPLTLLDEDGNVVRSVDEADAATTLDNDGPNAATVQELDTATWEVIEDGCDEAALLEIVNDCGAIEDGDEETVLAVTDAAQNAGYVHLATWSLAEDHLYEIDAHGCDDWADVLGEVRGVHLVDFRGRHNSMGLVQSETVLYFCKREDLGRVQRDMEADERVFCARIEEDYNDEGMGHEHEIETEEEFEAYAKGDPTGYVIFENRVYTKADRDGEGDWRLYQRDDNDGTWTQF